jgi:stage II sporulation protein D
MKKGIIKVLSFILFLVISGCAGSVHRVPDRTGKLETEPLTIRVMIEKNVNELYVITEDAYLNGNGSNNRLPESSTLKLIDGYISISGRKSTFSMPVSIQSQNKISINGKDYFGEITINDNLILNTLPVEEYLKGVLSSEISNEWPIEVLKTQAVVSRTYAYHKILVNKNNSYDVDDTTMYQKYDYTDNNTSINSAITDTMGIVILYQNKPIEAFFHACSGGVTENVGDIFQIKLPYLRSVPDPYCSNRKDSYWTFSAGESEIKSRLRGIINEEHQSLYLRDIKIYKRTGSRRVGEFVLIFEKNKKQVIKGNTFRLAVGSTELKSLLIQSIHRERRQEGYVFTFSGRGYGHGVGLSQLGAKEMAERGFGFKDIIGFYYRGTTLGSYN